MISLHKALSRTAAAWLVLTAVTAFGQNTQNSAPANNKADKSEFKAPLGLPRLKAKQKNATAQPVSSAAYKVEAIDTDTNGNGAALQRGTSRVLQLEATGEWTKPLVKANKKSLYVSFLLYASDTTTVTIDGAWLGVARVGTSNFCQLMVGVPSPNGIVWRTTGVNAVTQAYNGNLMSEFPVVTVRIDQMAGVWDLYVGPRQVADSILLERTKATQKHANNFLVHAGVGRAWVGGVVQSTENPLFEDSNDNGIDDEYEKSGGKALLSEKLSPAQRHAMAKEWQHFSSRQRGEAWLLDKPRPDASVATSNK